MSRVVISGTAPYDVFVGRGRCLRSGEESEWAIPREIALCDRRAARERYRVWLWSEICAERVDLAALAGLHGKVFGARRANEAWHAPVLEAGAMWALAEQARRLEARLAQMNKERRRKAARERGARR